MFRYNILQYYTGTIKKKAISKMARIDKKELDTNSH